MNELHLARLAKKIIKNNQYVTIATVNNKAKPWISPVYYYLDKSFVLYYASHLTSVHTKNIFHDRGVACAIFDSSANEGTGIGVQMTAKAEIVQGKELIKATKRYIASQKFVTEEMIGENGPYKLFKITPREVFVGDPDAKEDRRVRVRLKISKAK